LSDKNYRNRAEIKFSIVYFNYLENIFSHVENAFLASFRYGNFWGGNLLLLDGKK
jgi:hypothetical protein